MLFHAINNRQNEPLQVERRQLNVLLLTILEHIEETGRSGDLYPRIVQMPLHSVHNQMPTPQLVLDRLVPIELEEMIECVEEEERPVVEEALERGVEIGFGRLGSDARGWYRCRARSYRVVAAEAPQEVQPLVLVVEEHESRDARRDRLDRVQFHSGVVVVLVG